ncbi:MAG: hypothetical protein EOP01_08690, partial [Propionibacteriaceae bacterium]
MPRPGVRPRAPRPSTPRTTRTPVSRAPRQVLAVLVACLAGLALVATPASAEASRARVSPYVALGDSFSSGEGAGGYDPATDTANDRCHRSGSAYPELVAAAESSRRPLTFAACSGALTYDLSHPNHLYASEPAQDEALGKGNRKVSLTIGGNDLGFADVLGACLAVPGRDGRGCSKDPRLTGLVEARLAALGGQGRR